MLEGIAAKWVAGKLLNCAWEQTRALGRRPELLDAFERACQEAATERPTLFSNYTSHALAVRDGEDEGEGLAGVLQDSFGTSDFPTPYQLGQMLLESWRARKASLKAGEAAPLFEAAEDTVLPVLQRLADLFFWELAQIDSLRNPFIVIALQQVLARSDDLQRRTSTLQVENAERKMKEGQDELVRNKFESAAALYEEAADLARVRGDLQLQQKGLLFAVRALGEHFISGRLDERDERGIISRIRAHIDKLEGIGEKPAVIALERALLARLEGRPEETLRLSDAAAQLADDDALIQAGVLVARLQAHWQLGRVEEGAALAENVSTVRSALVHRLELTACDARLVLEAAWLRTLCRADKVSQPDVDLFVDFIRTLADDGKYHRERLAHVLNQVASEFGGENRLNERLQLCELAYQILEPLCSGRQLTLLSLEIAEVAAAMGDADRARLSIGRADQWTSSESESTETDSPEHVSFEAHRLYSRARILTRLAERIDPPDQRYQEAYNALIAARDFADLNRTKLRGDVELFLSDLSWWMGRTLINLGQIREGAEVLKVVRSEAAIANSVFASRVVLPAWLLEAEALALSGNLPESAKTIESLLKDSRFSDEAKSRPRAFQSYLENTLQPVVGWLDSAAARRIGQITLEQSLRAAVSAQFSSLLGWWKEWNVDDKNPGPVSELLDFWGRGGFLRVAAAVRSKPHAAIAVDGWSLDDVRKSVRIFSPLFDTVIVKWKGEIGAGLVISAIHETYGDNQEDFGGHGYAVTAGSAFSHHEGWHPAMSWANPLPQELTQFLAREALPLVEAGRLVVLPAPLVGCTQTAVGWTDTLLVNNLLGGVVNVARADHSSGSVSGKPQRVLDITKFSIPFIDNVSLPDLAKVLDETEQWSGSFRSLLLKMISSEDLNYERWERVSALEHDIREACNELRDRLASLAASNSKMGWTVVEEGGSASAGSNGSAAPANEPITSLLQAVTASSRELAPWIPYVRLQDHGGYLNWTCPLNNPSTPPDAFTAARLNRGRELHNWLYPGSAGWTIPTVYVGDSQ